MQIIYINGPSSSGKTTLSKFLQAEIRAPFLHISFDKIIGWMPQKMNHWNDFTPCSGFSWTNRLDEQGISRPDLLMGPFALKMRKIFLDIVIMLAKEGCQLIVDDFLSDQIEIWKNELKDYSVLWVKLTAPPEILEDREKKRNGRLAGSARVQYDHFRNKIGYDMEFDTHTESMNDLAKRIKEEFVRREISDLVGSIPPLDDLEAEQIAFVKSWIDSGVEIFRLVKPAIPDTHLVAYFVLIDPIEKKVLLTDHKKSGLWLPAGGHLEPGEHPNETVEREIFEELGIQANYVWTGPLFLTVTRTAGSTPGHLDVSLWYVLKGSATDNLKFDEREFHQVRWFSPSEIPYTKSDPQMTRFMQKLNQSISIG